MPKIDQRVKALAFRALHEREGAFVMPNPWDAGSARILTALGFEALATTSAGLAFSLGVRDGSAHRGASLANAAAIVAATDLPVSADLENGFGHRPEAVAKTIRLASAAGLVGGSIEDATGDAAQPIYAFADAVERVAAAVEASRSLATGFVLTARAENFIHGRMDFDDTIRRLVAFEQAGADVLYAPGLPNIAAVRAVCQAVSRPVNVVAGWGSARFSVAQLAEAGVRRISLGSALARIALQSLITAAREIREDGTFDRATDAVSYAEANAFMRPPPGESRRRRSSLGNADRNVADRGPDQP